MTIDWGKVMEGFEGWVKVWGFYSIGYGESPKVVDFEK